MSILNTMFGSSPELKHITTTISSWGSITIPGIVTFPKFLVMYNSEVADYASWTGSQHQYMYTHIVFYNNEEDLQCNCFSSSSSSYGALVRSYTGNSSNAHIYWDITTDGLLIDSDINSWGLSGGTWEIFYIEG